MSANSQLQQTNQRFYDALWSRSRLIEPQRFNTWPEVETLCEGRPRRLEVAPGMRPRLPVRGTRFADISEPALRTLADSGGLPCRASVERLPFADASFDLIAVLDVIEHVEDDAAAVSEVRRLLAPGGRVLMSVPLYQSNWTQFDALVGHRRRYDPSQLRALLNAAGLHIDRCAVYGMKPKSSWLVDFGMWHLKHTPRMAMWWYNRVFMPMGLKRQPPLRFQDGLIEDPAIDEVILICSADGEDSAQSA